MKIDENQIALLCLLVICLSCVFMDMEGAKDVVLALGGGIAGFLTKSAITNDASKNEPSPIEAGK